jgi:hypothetical protein
MRTSGLGVPTVVTNLPGWRRCRSRTAAVSVVVCRRGTEVALEGESTGWMHAFGLCRRLQSGMLTLPAQNPYLKSLGVSCIFKESPFGILLIDQISSDQQCKKLFMISVVALRAAFEVGSYISQHSSQCFGGHFGRLL